jgi:hypothetical protein
MELYGDLAGEAIARHLGPVPGVPASRLARNDGDDPQPWPPHQLTPQETALAEVVGEVVHRLFAAGLSLASAQSIIGDGAAGNRVASAIDELDHAIRDIRTAIFDPPR